MRSAEDGYAAADGMSARERDFYDNALRGHVHGTEDEVVEALGAPIERGGADDHQL